MSSPVLVILAGGLGRRLGGVDKALVPLAGRPLLAHVAARLAGQGAPILLSANGDPARYAAFGLPVIPDSVPDGVPDRPGPLAGLLAGLDWAAQAGARDVVTVAADGPFLPPDLVRRLSAARDAAGAEIAMAVSGGRRHPVAGLWPAGLAARLRRDLAAGARRVEAWADQFRVAEAGYPIEPIDPFFNVNTPDDLAAAERLHRTLCAS